MKNFTFYSPDEPAGASTEPASTGEAPSTWIDTETRAFSENWREILPEDIRGEKCLEPYESFDGLIKSFVHNSKAYGKDKIVIPNENSTQSDWDAFYKVAGRPDTVGDYNFKYTEDDGIPNEALNPDIVNPFLDEMYQAGASKKMLDIVKKYKAMEYKSTQQLMEQQEEEAIQSAETALKTKWAGAYEERVGLAKRVIAATTSEGEQRDALEEAIGNNPIVLEWISDQLGKKLVETKMIDTTLQVKTPVEIKEQIQDLQATEGYMNGTLKQTNPAKFDSITQKLRALHLQLNPN